MSIHVTKNVIVFINSILGSFMMLETLLKPFIFKNRLQK